MTTLMKTHALIGAVILLCATNYSSNSFAHPPDGYGIPEKYRTSEKPQTEIDQDDIEQQQDMAKLSKECKLAMKKVKVQSEDDGVWGTKKSVTPEAKEINVKIKTCKVALKNTTTDKK